MRIPIYQVDAFTERLFGGNPAAVMLLERYPEDAVLLAIAAENNLAETAFLVPDGQDYRLRWFTPGVEVPLCGHATLASAAVVMERMHPGRTSVVFRTLSGPLPVRKSEIGYVLNFPARVAVPVQTTPDVAKALNAVPVELLITDFNYLAILESEHTLRSLRPDMGAVAALDRAGLIVSAPAEGRYDFVSRYFAPVKGIPEDPVTGAAHCTLAPYWGSRLGKTALRGFQASTRGGEVLCQVLGDRVELEGATIFFLEGHVNI